MTQNVNTSGLAYYAYRLGKFPLCASYASESILEKKLFDLSTHQYAILRTLKAVEELSPTLKKGQEEPKRDLQSALIQEKNRYSAVIDLSGPKNTQIKLMTKSQYAAVRSSFLRSWATQPQAEGKFKVREKFTVQDLPDIKMFFSDAVVKFRNGLSEAYQKVSELGYQVCVVRYSQGARLMDAISDFQNLFFKTQELLPCLREIDIDFSEAAYRCTHPTLEQQKNDPFSNSMRLKAIEIEAKIFSQLLNTGSPADSGEYRFPAVMAAQIAGCSQGAISKAVAKEKFKAYKVTDKKDKENKKTKLEVEAIGFLKWVIDGLKRKPKSDKEPTTEAEIVEIQGRRENELEKKLRKQSR